MGALAVARRDLLATFATLSGWVLVAMFLVPCGAVFAIAIFRNGSPATLRELFQAAGWILVFAAPAITMRSLSEELRQGTYETLAASPVREGAVVAGKFLAALVTLAAMLAPAAVLALALERHGRPDYGEMLCGAGGVLLFGGLCLATGILASTLGSSQLVAYVVAMFAWLMLTLCCRLLPPLVPEWLSRVLDAADPLRRLRDFTVGLLDTAHVTYFVLLALAALAAATRSLRSRRAGGASALSGRTQAILRSVAAFGLAVAGVMVASLPQLRAEVDLTRTRAYALSERTQGLLADLDGPWSITVAASDLGTAPATRRQIDEVLRRFSEAAPGLRTRRLDPTDPAALGAWEALIEEISAAAARSSAPPSEGASTESPDERANRVAAALDEGQRELALLTDFAERQAEALAALPPAGVDEVDRPLAALRAALGEYAARAGELAQAVQRLRSTSAQQPLPDVDAARAALVANHATWSDQLATASTLLKELAARSGMPDALRAYARSARGTFEERAMALRRSQDRLGRLPASPLSEIGRQLATGEAAVVIGPPGVAVVPGWQLLPADPRANEAASRVDRRFRGEQVLASAIESLRRPTPVVVLVHAEDRSMLRPGTDRNDLVAAADALRSARIEVREWLTADPMPQLPQERSAVFLILPPQRRSGADISPAERILLDRARRLVDEGRPVLLTLGRSLRPLMRQTDPWAELCAALGVAVDTGTVVLEIDRLGPGRGATRSWQRVEPALTPHPVSSAIAGQGLVLTHTMPMSVDGQPGGRGAGGILSSPSAAASVADPRPPSGADSPRVLVAIEPGERRWLESDWRNETQERASPPEGRGLRQPVPVALAIERSRADLASAPRSGERGDAAAPPTVAQRIVVVSSGGWLLSSVLDLAEPLGGGRVIPANPGNRELLLAATLWLAGLDDQIAPGPASAGAVRLSGIAPLDRTLWGVLAIAGLPLLSLGMGTAITLLRRRA